MYFSGIYPELKKQRESDPITLTNKNFNIQVVVTVKDWEIHKQYFKKGKEILPDDIPGDYFSAMVQSDRWEIVSK